MTIKQLLAFAKQQLASHTNNPMLEAEILCAFVLKKPRSYLFAYPEQMVSGGETKKFAECLQRRCHKEPIAYITGMKEFWSLELNVSADTLIPRPETELLVETVLKLFPDKKEKITVADLGAGSGAIALALAYECPAWQIYATDISQNALYVAEKNAQRLGLKNIIFLQGDWCAALPFDLSAHFDVLVSNPPYIAETEWQTYADELAFEPRSALTAGMDGLDAIRTIVRSAKNFLKPKGHLIVEHGFLQAQTVREIFTAETIYDEIFSARDMAGHERMTAGRYCRGKGLLV